MGSMLQEEDMRLAGHSVIRGDFHIQIAVLLHGNPQAYFFLSSSQTYLHSLFLECFEHTEDFYVIR